MFEIGGGKVVNLWSYGDFSGTGTGPIDYGVAVASHDTSLDYVGRVAAVPEPSTYALSLVGLGLGGMMVRRRAPPQLIQAGPWTTPRTGKCGVCLLRAEIRLHHGLRVSSAHRTPPACALRCFRAARNRLDMPGSENPYAA